MNTPLGAVRQQTVSAGHPRTEHADRLLVESVREYAIPMLDSAGTFAAWNEGARSCRGFGAEDIAGKHCSALHNDHVKRGR